MIELPELSILPHENPSRYWRSLEEYANTPEFTEFIHREYPSQESVLIDPLSRRNFLKLMSASLALAGISPLFSGCTYQPKEEIVPYSREPREGTAGKPLFFSTAFSFAGDTIGVRVRSNDGRPTKVEGNPNHPASLGATDAFAEASILDLYDSDRSKTVLHNGYISSWSNFLQEFRTQIALGKIQNGKGLRILTETVISPTLGNQLKEILTTFPEAKWHQYDSSASDNIRAGSQLAFGAQYNTLYKFDQADRILSLDADFLGFGPGHLRYIRDFSSRRNPNSGKEMNRLYMAESTPTLTGAKADHKISVNASRIGEIASDFAKELGLDYSSLPGNNQQWIHEAAKDLLQYRGSSIIIAGAEQPGWVHHLAHLMNHELGNIGQTVFYTAPIEENPQIQSESLRELVQAMQAGEVTMLIIIGGNPVYTAPFDLDFKRTLAKVNFSIHLGNYVDETSDQVKWHIPETHYLEEWSDSRAYDGTVSIIQPLIAPLYQGKSAHELFNMFSDNPGKSGYDIIKDYWKSKSATENFETFWRTSLHDGVIPQTAYSPLSLSPNLFTTNEIISVNDNANFEILFRHDPSVYDGRFANNGWLQELPRPLTKITWDNAALISPKIAKQLNIETGFGPHGGDYITNKIEIDLNGKNIEIPVWILPGQPDNCITLNLGYGRTHAGKIGNKVGVDVNQLRNSSALWNATGARVRKIDAEYILAVTQHHNSIDGRDLVLSFEKNHEPQITNHQARSSLYPPVEYNGYAWGMSIDLNSCIGCNACITSCQSENNIPVVGKDQVSKSREMHWIRIDRYYSGNPDLPEETSFQPLPCMHCEDAPCEEVCPVGATVHSAEGLNDMVYNRCVGTRYCSNNCPYKVRRFNFLLYQDWRSPALAMMRNPEVSVRSRGVMEKCTYCVQRIQTAKITSEEEGRLVRDGEIKTACQAACPAEAILFGNINDPDSKVAKLKKEQRNYSLLEDLNTRPRTTYLQKIKNPNPEMKV